MRSDKHEGWTEKALPSVANQPQEPELPPSAFGPPSLDASWWDAATREGFYESAYALLERRLASAFDEIGHLRGTITKQRAQYEDVLGQLAEWRVLAFRYGTETTAEKRLRENNLHGTITVARELIMHGGDEAITYACVNLAKKMRAAAKRPERAPVPAVELSRSSPETPVAAEPPHA